LSSILKRRKCVQDTHKDLNGPRRKQGYDVCCALSPAPRPLSKRTGLNRRADALSTHFHSRAGASDAGLADAAPGTLIVLGALTQLPQPIRRASILRQHVAQAAVGQLYRRHAARIVSIAVFAFPLFRKLDGALANCPKPQPDAKAEPGPGTPLRVVLPAEGAPRDRKS
jgi:hypothetical protein